MVVDLRWYNQEPGSATTKEATLAVCTAVRAVTRPKLGVPRALKPKKTAG